MTLLSQLQPQSSIPLEFLVPQMLCFAFEPAANGTKDQEEFTKYQDQIQQLEKQLEDSTHRNKELTDLSKHLQEQLHNASQDARETYDKMTELHRNASIRKQYLQEKKIQLQQQINSPRIQLLDQVLKLKEYQDQCKLILNDMKQHKVTLLQDIGVKQADLKTATENTKNLESDIDKKQRKIDAVKRKIQQVKKEIEIKMASVTTVTNGQKGSTLPPTEKPKSVTTVTNGQKGSTLPPTEKPKVKSKEDILQEKLKTELSGKSAAELQAFTGEGAATGNLTLLKVLAELGVDLSTPDQVNLSPLDWAAISGNIDVAETLIDAGADVNAKSGDENSPLHWAARKGPVNFVEILLNAGADPNAQNNLKSTPLHEAAYYGQVDIVRLLIDKGADVNAKNGELNTPLHFAANSGSLQTVKLLEGKGADLNAVNRAGHTPQEEAKNAGKKDVVEWIANQ